MRKLNQILSKVLSRSSDVNSALTKDAPEGVKVTLRRLYWVEEQLVIEGWVTLDGEALRPATSIEVRALQIDGVRGSESYRLAVTRAEWLDPNSFLDSSFDLESSTFCATISLANLPAVVSNRKLQFVVRTSEYGKVDIPFNSRYRRGSAGHPQIRMSSDSRHAAHWDETWGLTLYSTHPAVYLDGVPEISANGVTMALRAMNDFVPVAAFWDSGQDQREVALLDRGVGVFFVTVTAVEASQLPADQQWMLTLVDHSGRERKLHWEDESWRFVQVPGSDRMLTRKQGGLVRLIEASHVVEATSVTAGNTMIWVRPFVYGTEEAPRLMLRGPRAELIGSSHSELAAVIPMEHRPWGRTVQAPPSGTYKLWAEFKNGTECRVLVAPQLLEKTPRTIYTEYANLQLGCALDGQLCIDIGPPHPPGVLRAYNQRRIVDEYWNSPRIEAGDLQGVFLESWYGKTVSDNPAPLVQALRNAGVAGPYFFAVADRSVELNLEDVTPVLTRSREYWQAIHTARIVVINTWLPNEYRKQPGQFVVQTWHGTPLKKLGVDVPERAGNEGSERRLAIGSSLWDVLVSQNTYSTEHLRRAYVYDGAVIESGYPRNDCLIGERAEHLRATVRARLQLDGDSLVILYAPTWRQDEKGKVGVLDIDALLGNLPDGTTILLRGHSVSLRRGVNSNQSGVLDVTAYPEVSDLIAASDCLVTDYSSIMFDYAVTGRPILFFVPDYNEYLRDGRGGYFNLSKEAPGPLVKSVDELVDALRFAFSSEWKPSSSYAHWKENFLSHEDGEAANRVAEYIRAQLSA